MPGSFSNSSDVRGWLNGLRGENKAICISRCALRTLPHMGFGQWRGTNELAALAAFRDTLALAAGFETTNDDGDSSVDRSLQGLIGIEMAAVSQSKTVAVHAATAAGHAASAAVGSVGGGASYAALAAQSAAAAAEAGALANTLATTVDSLVAAAHDDSLEMGRSSKASIARDEPLWSNRVLPKEVQDVWTAFQDQLLSTNPKWAFWRRWYQGVLDGNPMDLLLQKRVAAIPDSEWELGPERIASAIDEILARDDVRERAQEAARLIALERDRLRGIGHNNPPERLDDLPIQQVQLDEAEVVVAQVLAELEPATPNRTRLANATDWIGKALRSAGAWFATKVDGGATVFVNTFAALTATAAFDGIRQALGQSPAILDALTKLLQSIEKWLSLLP